MMLTSPDEVKYWMFQQLFVDQPWWDFSLRDTMRISPLARNIQSERRSLRHARIDNRARYWARMREAGERIK
jgi:hypothetical protein